MHAQRYMIVAALLVASCAPQTSEESATVRKERITKTATLNVGTPTVVEASSPTSKFVVVFEDDGETGFFYGLDPSRGDQPVLDALHIYDVNAVRDRDQPSIVQIAWSASGEHAALLINSHAHAVFDFSGKRGYCRTGFPPPDGNWTSHPHEWDDAALSAFR